MNNWHVVAFSGALLLALFACQPFFVPQTKVVFLDIGQGDSILFQQGMQQILVDGGADMTVLQRLSSEMPFFDKKLDVLVATHPDKDHLGGLLHVIRRYEVGLVLLPYVPHSSSLQEKWLRELQDKNIPYRFVWQSDELHMTGASFHFLSPTVSLIQNLHGKTNNGSLVARVEMAGLSFLLTGDMEAQIERLLTSSIEENLLNVDVLKVGHHGSKTSTSPEFLAAASPGLAVISVGSNNPYGHPYKDVLDRLSAIQVLRTDEEGSIRLTYTNNSWLLSCSKKSCMKM